MRRTRIEHMSSAYYPIATAKRTFRSSRAGERPLFAERNLWNFQGVITPADVRELDHLASILGFLGDQLTKIGRVAREARCPPSSCLQERVF